MVIKSKDDLLLNIEDDISSEAFEFYSEFWDWNENIPISGETIITFNTVAGALIRAYSKYIFDGEVNIPKGSKNRIKMINSCNNIPFEVRSKATTFYEIYQSSANFMPFPKSDRTCSLNYYKNKIGHDFPDIYLEEIKQYYSNKKKYSEHNVFINKTNVKYFNSFGTFSDYVVDNYLECFFTDETFEKAREIFPSHDIKILYRSSKNFTITNDYLRELDNIVIKFFDNAIEIVNNRAALLKNRY